MKIFMCILLFLIDICLGYMLACMAFAASRNDITKINKNKEDINK